MILGASFATGALTTHEGIQSNPAWLWLLFSVHKSLGIVALTFALGRGFLWLRQPVMRLAHHGSATALASGGMQGTLLAGSLALPLLGIAADAFLRPTAPIFGLSVETLKPASDPALALRLGYLHTVLAYGVACLVVIHVAAALKHHFWDRDKTLRAMAGPVENATAPVPMAKAFLFGVCLVASALAVADRGRDGTSEGVDLGARQAGTWDLLHPDSMISAHTNAEGFDITAQFTRFDAEITFDPASPQAAAVLLVIDATSFVSGFPVVDERVASVAWLNSTAFAHIRWSAQGARPIQDGFAMSGTLTMLGRDHPVEVWFDFIQNGQTARALGRTTLARLDIGLGTEGDNAAAGIDLTFDFHVIRRSRE